MKVFATSRALRSYYTSQLEVNQLIPKAITIAELFSKMVLVEGRVFIDAQTRLLLLAQASDFEGFMKLQIDRDLFSFLHNSDYIFRFFEELSGELVAIESIDAHDTYEEYGEHLAILKELRSRYKTLLDTKGLIDPIFVPQHYILNTHYLRTLKHIDIHLEGYLTSFELLLLRQACEVLPVTVRLFANAYNRKLQARLGALGFVIEPGYVYELALHNTTILSKQAYTSHKPIVAQAFSERVLQAAFIKRHVYAMTQEQGMDPASIVVVLPHEGFATTLALYDDEDNFNFAMGLPFAQTLFYKRIHAAMLYFDHTSQEHTHRFRRFAQGIESAFEVLRLHYSQTITMDFFEKLIALFCVGNDSVTQEIIDGELFAFRKLSSLLNGSTCKVYVRLFMQRLSKATLDDVTGGKITVMGVLETRGSQFDGVIVVDFNDDFVPKKSQKDLFLSSAIKAHVGLPTTKDREALQKYFYMRLFEQAKSVAIAYVHNEASMPSRFLTELGITPSLAANENLYSTILYPSHTVQPIDFPFIRVAYDFTSKPLSASALKRFLTCKRSFYYRYIVRLKGHEIPQDMPKEHIVGEWLHALLEAVYRDKKSFHDIASLRAEIEKTFHLHGTEDEMGRYLVRLWLEKLTPFYAQEIARFSQGYEVYVCEKELQTNRFGITLTGKIDRIDIRDGMLSIIDYKSGSIHVDTPNTLEKTTDFQLEFYTLLAQNLGEVSQAAFYDLNSGTLLEEVLLEEKLSRLDEILSHLSQTKSFDFDMCEDISACRYCDYVYLCGRN